MRTSIILPQSKAKLNFSKLDENLLSVNQNGLIEQENNLPEILFVTSFPPRECGIATYSQDLVNALSNQFNKLR